MHMTMLAVGITIGIGFPGTPTAWHGDYAKAHAEACTSDKPLFIVICPGSSEYAQMIALGVFLSEELEQSLRVNYVRFLVDTETPEGKALAKQFDAGEDPHFVIIDRSGKWQVYYQTGFLLDRDLAPVLARFRRSKLTAEGRPAEVVTPVKRQTIQLCST